MPKLLIKLADRSPQETELGRGVFTLGRSSSNSLQVDDRSVSGTHCQLIVSDTGVLVRDLDSTNGTFVDGRQVTEAPLAPGQTLRLGNVEMALFLETTATRGGSMPRPAMVDLPVPSVAPGVMVCQNHVKRAATVVCRNCGANYCDECVNAQVAAGQTMRLCRACGGLCSPLQGWQGSKAAAADGFFQAVPKAFLYPLRQDGTIVLLAGAIILPLARLGGVFSLLLMLLTAGYLMAFLQGIVQESADGKNALPPWPDFTSPGDFFHPLGLFLGTILLCFGPAIAFDLFTDEKSASYPFISMALMAAGCLYLPMALMAVCVRDRVTAANPILVVVSIGRVPLEYITTCVFLGLAVGSEWVSEYLLNNVVPHLGIARYMVVEFVSLYFLAVQMRLIGLLYYYKQAELGW